MCVFHGLTSVCSYWIEVFRHCFSFSIVTSFQHLAWCLTHCTHQWELLTWWLWMNNHPQGAVLAQGTYPFFFSSMGIKNLKMTEVQGSIIWPPASKSGWKCPILTDVPHARAERKTETACLRVMVNILFPGQCPPLQYTPKLTFRRTFV